jgi:AraC-like DNA-binding protein
MSQWWRNHLLSATVSIAEHRELGAMREFCLLSYLRYVHGYACWAVDSRISLVDVRFPFAAPPHAGAYSLMFPGPVSFGAERAHFTFDARYLALPQRRDERAMGGMLQHALPLTVRQYHPDRLVVDRVKRLLAEDAGAGLDAETIAMRLCLSKRSLHRHLTQEGASLQALKDAVRRDRALDLLSRTDRPLKQVANAVGFADEKSFARAFKAWTGETPGELRRAGTGRVSRH